jgi:CheY-like chemotaxis protein/acyl-coenzyme A thioesterase PaaI-like protein
MAGEISCKGPERILFVDDDHHLGEIAQEMLEYFGYQVTIKTNSIEALALFRRQADHFDLIMTDMTMPNLTGDKLAREIRKIRPDIPIILCTGYSECITQEEALAMGIREFIMKPFVMRDLEKTVREVLVQMKEKNKDTMKIVTHQKIDRELCGSPMAVKERYSKVKLVITDQMAVDSSGLAHGGFIFGLADYAAMIAVNHPNVVLGSADVKFLKPVRTNETVVAEARVDLEAGKKRKVSVIVQMGDEKVFEGVFTCFVLEKHVLG